MDAMMKECMKPHALAHMMAGLGVGFILVGLFPTLGASALMLGLLVLVLAMVADYAMQNKML